MDSSVDSVVHSVVVVAVDSADVAVDSAVGDVAVSLLAVELLADELLAVELAASVNAESKFGHSRWRLPDSIMQFYHAICNR